MIIRASSLAQCRQRLATVNKKIDVHVLNSPRMKAAQDVLAEHRNQDKAVIAGVLSDKGLPTPSQQRRALLFGLTSLSRLNRTRIKLETRIAHLEPR